MNPKRGGASDKADHVELKASSVDPSLLKQAEVLHSSIHNKTKKVRATGAKHSQLMDTSNQNCVNDLESELQKQQPISKSAQKKLLKQERYEVKKAQKKAYLKEQKIKEAERKKREWGEKLEACKNEEEKNQLIESRKGLRKERMEQRAADKDKKIERLNNAKKNGQKIVIDLDFSDLMNSSEINSLCQQIMYCYAVNGRSPTPAHLWLTGCLGETHNHLQRLPGYDKWVIEKECRSYIESFEDQKENLVYLTADSETTVDELDLGKVYIIGGLVDRNRWKGITQKKAIEQGIQTAKLPIGNFLKMSSSQVLTVNQVVEILLKYLETKNWKTSFFAVIPQRKRCDAETETTDNPELEDNEVAVIPQIKRCEVETETSDNPELEDNEVAVIPQRKRREAEIETTDNPGSENNEVGFDQESKRHCIET